MGLLNGLMDAGLKGAQMPAARAAAIGASYNLIYHTKALRIIRNRMLMCGLAATRMKHLPAGWE